MLCQFRVERDVQCDVCDDLTTVEAFECDAYARMSSDDEAYAKLLAAGGAYIRVPHKDGWLYVAATVCPRCMEAHPPEVIGQKLQCAMRKGATIYTQNGTRRVIAWLADPSAEGEADEEDDEL